MIRISFPKWRMRLPAILILALGLAAASQAQAQAFPTKTVTIVVPYPPGGGSDALARSLSLALSAHWGGQTVVVENVAGADGIIGTQKVLRAPADGHTILLQVNQMLLYKAAGNNIMDQLRLISKIQHSPLSFAVSTSFRGNTFEDFVAYCKAAKPPCSWGSSTKYGTLIGRHLMDAAGLKDIAVHAPYKGTGPMMNDLLGGHITMGLPAVSSGLPQYRNGKLKYLAVGSAERFNMLPNVPTLKESGYNVLGNSWFGLMVSKDTPQRTFDAIWDAVKTISRSPALLATIEGGAALPVFSDPAAFAQEVKQEMLVLEPLMAKFPVSVD
ncbi:tripartite tricarboxylate transporter substrate binding protein [Ramlibacter sp.]|uniref:tripartite tricarboxylate transporter substrate binding protein n=1 Tax=Ramlibacter sp. TaxID=1917967 RepID=UPI003D13A6E4